MKNKFLCVSKFVLSLFIGILLLFLSCSTGTPEVKKDHAKIEQSKTEITEIKSKNKPAEKVGIETKDNKLYQIVSAKTFKINPDKDLKDFAGIELWMTTDDGFSWNSAGFYENARDYIRFSAPSDGKYGFYISRIDANGNKEFQPVTGTAPEIRVIVDTTPPIVVLEKPNGGEVFKNNGYNAIEWTVVDDNLPAESIAINISSDNGNSWLPVSESESNDGKFYWELPRASSTNYRIKITATDAAGNSASDMSDNTFTVDGIPPKGIILSPVKSNSNNVEIGYSAQDIGGAGIKTCELWGTLDNGLTWKKLAIDDDNVSPMLVSLSDGNYGLRLLLQDNVGNTSEIPVNGKIKPEFQILVDTILPEVRLVSFKTLNEVYAGNKEYDILWAAGDDNLIDNPISLFYSDNNGVSWNEIPGGINISNDSQPIKWKLPNQSGATFKLKITARDKLNNIGEDISPTFKIEAGFPTAIAKGEAKFNLKSVNINYELRNIKVTPVSRVFLWYTTDNGLSWNKYGMDNDVTSPFHIELDDGAYGISITCATELGLKIGKFEKSPEPGEEPELNIEIDSSSPQLELLSFRGGEVFQGGCVNTIKWKINDLHLTEALQIYFSKDSGLTWTSIDNNALSALGKYQWGLPDLTTNTARIKIEAFDSFGNKTVEASKSDFAIDVTPPEVKASSLNISASKDFNVAIVGNDIGKAGIDLVTLYMRDKDARGAKWKEIGKSYTKPYSIKVHVSKDGNYEFFATAIDKAGNSAFLPEDNTAPQSITSVDSTQPAITLVNFRGGKIYKGNSVQEIKFKTEDAFSNALNTFIEFSSDNGNTWYKIVESDTFPSDKNGIKSYQWVIPAKTSKNCLFRITSIDSAQNKSSYISDTPFSIDADAPITKLLGPALTTAQDFIIDYSVKDSGPAGIKALSLYYKQAEDSAYKLYKKFEGKDPIIRFKGKDSQYDFVLLAEDSVGNVPDSPLPGFAPQLTVLVDSLPPTVQLANPKGKMYFKGDDVVPIKWKIVDNNLIKDFILIEASYNNGINWEVIASNEPNDGIFNWTVPGRINSDECLIKITGEDKAHNINSSSTPTNFVINNIQPTVFVNGPKLSSSRKVNISFTQKTNNMCAIAQYKLYYSKNNGSSWKLYNTYSANEILNNVLPVTLNDGLYSLWLTAVDASGMSSLLPQTGSLGQGVLLVDTQKPFVKFNGILAGDVFKGSIIITLSWEIQDENLGESVLSIKVGDSEGKNLKPIAEDLPVAGRLEWQTYQMDGNFQLVLEAKDSVSNFTTLSIPFSIDNTPPQLTLDELDKTLYKGGTELIVRWNAEDENLGQNPISIQASFDAGKNWLTVAKNIANTGNYAWTLPIRTASQCLVKVVAKDKVDNLTSNQIKRYFILDSAPPVIFVDAKTIYDDENVIIPYRANDEGEAGLKKVELWITENNGKNWNKLGERTEKNGAFNEKLGKGVYGVYSVVWDNVENQYPSKIPSPGTEPQKVFEVAPPSDYIYVKGVYNNMLIQTNQTMQIAWETVGTLPPYSVKVELSDSKGADWEILVLGKKANDGFSFLAPDKEGDYILRITAIDAASDSISNAFNIKVTKPTNIANQDMTLIKLRSINDGEWYVAGEKVVVRWEGREEMLNVNSVSIDFSYDGGGLWKMIKDGLPSYGEYEWIIPSIDSTRCVIRVSAVTIDGRVVSDQSTQYFNIKSKASSISISGIGTPGNEPDVPSNNNTKRVPEKIEIKKQRTLSTEEINRDLQMAREFFEKKNYHKANEYYKKIVGHKMNDFNILYNYAYTLEMLGEIDAAMGYFITAKSLKPNDLNVYFHLGKLYMQKQEFNKAVEAFELSLRQGETPLARYNLGYIYFQREGYTIALEQFLRALSLDSTRPEFYYSIGLTYKELGHYDKAIFYFNKTKELDADGQLKTKATDQLKELGY